MKEVTVLLSSKNIKFLELMRESYGTTNKVIDVLRDEAHYNSKA